MEKEKRTRGITDVLLILVITILAGTVLILACSFFSIQDSHDFSTKKHCDPVT